jgi:putative peptidoglycan lipid II flippase
METAPADIADARQVASGASWIALGNVASRGLGFLRELVRAQLFGAGPQVDALALAMTIPLQIYDLVTGGLINSALVPAFREYATPEKRAELWRLISLLLTLAVAVVSGLALVLTAGSHQVAEFFVWLGSLTGQHSSPESVTVAGDLMRWTLPAVIFLSASGILTAALYALQRFTLPAFTAAAFNAVVVVVALLSGAAWGVQAMAAGLLLGAMAQVVLQLPGLADGLMALRPALSFTHPGVRRVFRAYVPIIASTLVAQGSVYFGLSVAFGYAGGLSWMNYATNLYQFPLGLVAVAISSAILPTLSSQAAEGQGEAFRATLNRGLNLILVLIVPAAVGLFVLAEPIVALAFQRGAFTPEDTTRTAEILRWFVGGLSFAAVDQLLIIGFYARRDTLTPSLVGVASVAVYILIVVVARPVLGLLSLMLADSLKQIVHAVITGGLLGRRTGGVGQWSGVGKIVVAAAGMGLAVSVALWGLSAIGLPPGPLRHALLALGPGLIGLTVYLALARVLHIEELRWLLRLVKR